MITFDEALSIIKGEIKETGLEKVKLSEATGRILAEDVLSDINMPPFDKSAMDGFACRKADISLELEIIETIPAGKAPVKKIGQGQCSRIMTGAMIPEGADTVIKVEETILTEENRVKFTGEKSKANICYFAEDIREGDKLFSAGMLLKPQHIAVLATAGYHEVPVFRQPKVGIISTGSELVEPGIKPGPSQIRNSNGYQLLAQALHAQMNAEYVGIAIDDEDETYRIMKQAFEKFDVVILTGGVSMGDFDFIPAVMERLGVRQLFSSVAVQPGRPTVFGTKEGKYIFGLPGNPVSSFVIFEVLVKPLLYGLMGTWIPPRFLKFSLGKSYNRKNAGRLAWVPVELSPEGKVYPVEYHGSAHINALTKAFGIMLIPQGVERIEEGGLVDVRQI